MTARRKFEIVKRKVESNFENTGLSLYMLGYVMHGGTDRPLVRAENEDGAVVDVYFSGRGEYHDIQIKNPEAYRRISKRHGNVAKRLLKKCNREEDSLTDIALDMDEDFAKAVTIAEDVKLFGYAGDDKEQNEQNSVWEWRKSCVLYSDQDLMGECSVVHHDADGDHVYVEVSFSGHGENEYHELIVRLPECEIAEVFALDNPKEYDVNSLKTESVGEVLQRLALATDTIFEIARKQAEPDVTADDMNALRDKIDGKICRSMPIACPYCHKSFMGEHVHYVVHIPVKFYMHSGNFGVFEDEVYQSVTEAVEAGNVEGVCEFCGHTVTAEDINKVKDGWKYRWRYDPHN